TRRSRSTGSPADRLHAAGRAVDRARRVRLPLCPGAAQQRTHRRHRPGGAARPQRALCSAAGQRTPRDDRARRTATSGERRAVDTFALPLYGVGLLGQGPQQHELMRLGTLSTETVEFVQRCVLAELNILVTGGTGSGKTTLLNALSTAIPDNERIVTIEDAAELKLNQRHVLRLESRPKNIEGQGEI